MTATRAIRARDNVRMLVEHRGMRPEVEPSAWVAPTAVVCGAALFPGSGDPDFPGTVYGEPRGEDSMARVMPRQAAWLAAHRDDRAI